REVVKAEAELRGDVGIWRLLMRQRYVEADAGRADIRRSTIGRFHDAGPTARCDDIVAPSVPRRKGPATLRGNAGELPRDPVEVRPLAQALGGFLLDIRMRGF